MGRIAGLVTVMLLATSVLLVAALSLAGPSAAVPTVDFGAPVWAPTDLIATAATWLAILTGGTGAVIGVVAAGRGWRPYPRALFAGGVLAALLLAAVPVAGSTDALDYAVYGRIAVLGHDPWTRTPGWLFHLHDPVGVFAPLSWRDTTAAYGPVAVGFFGLAALLAALLGGASMVATVAIIKVASAAAFVLTGYLLDRAAGPDRARRVRVHLLWTVNPLMLWNTVAGAHVDVIAAALMTAAIFTLRRPGPARGGIAGALLGAAVAIKAPFVLAAGGLAWTLRRSPRVLAATAAGLIGVLGTGYAVAGDAAVRSLVDKHANRSMTDPWGPLGAVLRAAPHGRLSFQAAVALGALAVAAVAWWSLSDEPGCSPRVVPAFALALGWLVTSPVQHPWYDAMLFPLLALLPRTGLDVLLITRCAVSSLAYLPGMPVVLNPPALEAFNHGFYDLWLVRRLLDGLLVAMVVALALARRAQRLQRALST